MGSGVVVIVGTAKGVAVIRSDAARERWSVSALQLKGWIVSAATRDPQGRTYLGVTSDVYGAVILVSEDLEAWRQLERGPRYAPGDPGNQEHNRVIRSGDVAGRYRGSNRHVDQIWKLHAAADVVYAGVSEAGLFRSDDRGVSWSVDGGLNQHPTRSDWGPGFGGLCLHSLLCDARDPRRLWVGISAAGVFRSDDGGGSWAAKNDGVSANEGWCVHSLAHDPNRADVIYRQDHRGMYRTDDGGDSWQLIEDGLPEAELSDGHRCAFGFPISFDPGSGSVYAVPLEGDNFRFPPGGALRVYRTRDGGQRWEPLSKGLPGQSYAPVLRGALAVDGLDPCGVYFGTTAGSIFASRDGGDSWLQLPCTLPRVLCVEAFAA
ncbi:MAG: exo-alpha-sialidase [Myxococcota bacterium]